MDSLDDSNNSSIADERLESAIAKVLHGGVLFSATLVAVGGVIYLTQRHADTVNYDTFRAEPGDLRTLKGIIASAAHLQTDAIIQLGLVILIATPVARVALATLGFYLQGDHLYVSVSVLVLAILIFSLMHVL
jgi:uncharacterized membrane protein